MGGGGGTSSSATTTTTTSDSYNTTTDFVSNLSNVGNTSISLGAGGALDTDGLVKLLPFAILGSVLMIVAVVVASKRS